MENSVGERMGEVRRNIANGGELSHPLHTILMGIKEQENYFNLRKNKNFTHPEGLFEILYQYMKAKNALDKSFRSKNFNQHRTHTHGNIPLYTDCPLSVGEFSRAVRYGNENGLLINVGNKQNSRWVFTDKIKEMGT